ncbi:MAG: hypothetical protein QOJ56_2532 [Mycobacterium sp.]|nr:hypothetical protein [Mycobacterium sp.]
MAQAMFKAVGPQASREGYRDLIAYSTATILMLITLILAALQFADWLLAPPECLMANASSMSPPLVSTSPAGLKLPPSSSPKPPPPSDRPEPAMNSSGCACPS